MLEIFRLFKRQIAKNHIYYLRFVSFIKLFHYPEHFSLDQNYLLKRMQEEKKSFSPVGPFQVIHNFRFNPSGRQKPKRKISACERYQNLPEFTMRTRKMTAEIELQQQMSRQSSINNEQQLSNNAEPPMKVEEPQQFFLQNEDDLEIGIPLSNQANNDVLFNLEENSLHSNYSRLEKALFHFEIQDQEMEQQ